MGPYDAQKTYMNDFKNLITMVVHKIILFQINSKIIPNNSETAGFVKVLALQTCGCGYVGDNRAFHEKFFQNHSELAMKT